MIKVDIAPQWRFRRDHDRVPTIVLLELLNDIRTTGRITSAAARSKFSYRHAWGMIEAWGNIFGAPLVERRRGKGTKLTALGEKLVWAGQRFQARLGPQLQNISQELEAEINTILSEGGRPLRIHASHGFAVSALRDRLSREADLTIDLRYVTNPSSIVSLTRGECDLAGIHLPQGPLREQHMKTMRDLVGSADYRMIGFVTREMGLIVRLGNPARITNLKRLTEPSLHFINRDPGSGSRVLFDQLLSQEKVPAAEINGYEQFEFTHSAVAAFVASGMADAAFGVEAAARQFDLDFVKLVTEDYFFLCRREVLEMPAVKRIIDIIKEDDFVNDVLGLPGYANNDIGVSRIR